MQHKILTAAGVAMVLAIAAASCTKSSSAPTQSTTTTSVATTTSTTTSVATTSVPATFTVRGRVTSEKTGENLRFPVIEIIQGSNIGRRFTGNDDGTYTMTGLTGGAFIARFWAEGYLIKDVLITLTTTDLTVDVQLTPVPPTTTTTQNLTANFTWSPNPCTIGPGTATNCTVDGSSSTGNITRYHWAYAGKDVFDQISFALSFSCSNLIGTGTVVTLSVRLTVFDATGAADSIDQGVPVTKLGGACP
jgi:hypothetical protein